MNITLPVVVALACSIVPGARAGLLDDAKAGKSILFIGAHPDDEAMIGPFLARACKDYGNRCVVVTMTQGENGCFPGETPCGPRLKKVRSREFRRFAKLVGAEAIVLDYPDGAVGRTIDGSTATVLRGWNAVRDVRAELYTILRKQKPDVVITQEPTHGVYGHADHRVTGLLTTDVWRAHPELKASLYYTINRYASIFKDNLDPLPATDQIAMNDRFVNKKIAETYGAYSLDAAKVYVSQHYYEMVSRATESWNWFREVER